MSDKGLKNNKEAQQNTETQNRIIQSFRQQDMMILLVSNAN